MRQGGKNRSRGRNGRNGHKPHMPMRAQTFDSGGGEVRVRGNAWQVHERYLALARDAAAAGDRVAAENFFQHADHYYRMCNLNGEGGRPQHGQQHPHGQHPHFQSQNYQGQPQPQGQYQGQQQGQQQQVPGQPPGQPVGQPYQQHQGQNQGNGQHPMQQAQQHKNMGYAPQQQTGSPDDDRADPSRDRLPERAGE